MNSVKYLEAVKARYGLKNDRQLALHMKMGTNTIHQYTSGKRVMDDEACLAVALQLDLNPMEVLGAAFLDRAEKTGQKSLWEVFMTRAAMTAGAVLLTSGVNLFLTTNRAEAATMRVPEPQGQHDYVEYRLCEFWEMGPGGQFTPDLPDVNLLFFLEVSLLIAPFDKRRHFFAHVVQMRWPNLVLKDADHVVPSFVTQTDLLS